MVMPHFLEVNSLTQVYTLCKGFYFGKFVEWNPFKNLSETKKGKGDQNSWHKGDMQWL